MVSEKKKFFQNIYSKIIIQNIYSKYSSRLSQDYSKYLFKTIQRPSPKDFPKDFRKFSSKILSQLGWGWKREGAYWAKRREMVYGMWWNVVAQYARFYSTYKLKAMERIL